MEPENTCSKAGRPRGFCTETALDRAIDVFWRKGYDGTSLSDLTDAMGINRPSLYAAYGNKEELFRRALARYGEKSKALLREAEEQGSAKAFVDFFLRATIRFGAMPGRPAGCFALQGASNHCTGEDPIGQDVAKLRAGPMRAMACRIERAARDGELPADTDAAALARFYATVMHGLSVQAAGGATAEVLNGVVDTAMRAWPVG